jgi:hypothetical protein
MAGKGLYKKAGEELAPVEDRMPVPVPPRERQETFMGIDDTGAGASGMSGDTGDFLSRRLRVNPETGEAYSMDNLSPMGRQGAAPVRAPAVSRAGMAAAAAAADAGLANRAPVVGPRSTGAGGPTAAEIAAFRRQQDRAGAGRGGQGGPTARELEAYRRQQEDLAKRGRGYNTQYKKGGAVKAKKMASGGMTSASKRADGVATKGKTKCKMY